MSDTDKETRVLKRQVGRARQKVVARFRKAGYNVIDSNDDPFSFIGVRGVDIRFVRVSIGEVDLCLMRRIRSIGCPTNCTKELWEKNGVDFTFREIK